MKSTSQILNVAVLVAALFGFLAESFSQEKDSSKDEDRDPLSVPAVPDQPRVRRKFALPQAATERQMHLTVNNGSRSIQVTEGGQKIEITDTNGKDISLKHTRIVGGKSETKEYQAVDLDDLKAKSPEAATLYEKYTAQPVAELPAPFQNRLPINRLPINGRVPGKRPFLFGVELDAVNRVPRTIRVDLGDRKIEIHDSTGSSIQLRIVKNVDGKEALEEFTADNLQEFKRLHPEICPLYEKYTGLKAE